MDENQSIMQEADAQAEKMKQRREEIQAKQDELKKQFLEQMEEIKKRTKISNEAIKEGKGRLELEKPIFVRDKEIKELAYDFTVLTGMEYADAMDDDPQAQQAFRITYRQALSLFAKAAAKQTDDVDQKDILEQIGMTDAVEGVQLATLFFNASTRAGRLRISKR